MFPACSPGGSGCAPRAGRTELGAAAAPAADARSVGCRGPDTPEQDRSASAVLIAGFPAGPWGTNCYVVATGPGTECVVIDPGKDAAAGVAEVVREHKLKPVAVLRHPRPRRPHVVRRARRRHLRRHRLHPPRRPAPAQRPDGRHVAARPPGCCSAASTSSPSRTTSRELADGETLELAGLRVPRRPHPGHTEGSITFRTPYDEPRTSAR